MSDPVCGHLSDSLGKWEARENEAEAVPAVIWVSGRCGSCWALTVFNVRMCAHPRACLSQMTQNRGFIVNTAGAYALLSIAYKRVWRCDTSQTA
jgi:hypothetical protein